MQAMLLSLVANLTFSVGIFGGVRNGAAVSGSVIAKYLFW
jgi:hypothetical protein